MASVQQSSSLIELNDTNVSAYQTGAKASPNKYRDRDKKSAKGSRRYFKVESFAVVRLFHR
jgi:hypothetical protein